MFDVDPNLFRPYRVDGRRKSSPEYRSWQMMKNRCSNPNYEHYKHYGARGIGFDPAWANFDNFIRDMGPQPGPNYSLDREDANKHYGKGNCKWATKTEQSRNRRCCVLTLERAREIRTAYAACDKIVKTEFAREHGISTQLLSAVVQGKIWCE